MLTGLTDPFSSEAARAQYPDQGAGATLSFQQRLSSVISSSATGTMAVAINPKVNFPFLTGSATGVVATWGANWTGDAATNLVNTYAKLYRPTSCGVRICSMLSATNSSGYLIIAKGGIPAVGGVTTFNPSSFTHWDSHAITSGGEWHAVSHPKGSSAYDLKDPSLTNVNIADEQWETVYFYSAGLPNSTASFLIETFINYEYTAVEDAPIAQLAIPQPVFNAPLITAINEVQASHPASHKGNASVIKGFIKKQGKKALLKHVLPFAAKKATQLLL